MSSEFSYLLVREKSKIDLRDENFDFDLMKEKGRKSSKGSEMMIKQGAPPPLQRYFSSSKDVKWDFNLKNNFKSFDPNQIDVKNGMPYLEVCFNDF